MTSPEPPSEPEPPYDHEADAALQPFPVAMSRTEARLRKLCGRTSSFPGPIAASTRGWISRDGRLHILAARFLDFAVITEYHLVLCSTGFFTRRPRRRVFKEWLNQLTVVGVGPEPIRTLRVLGNFKHPILIELRDDEAAAQFVRELLARSGSGRTETEPAGTAASDEAAPRS